jgi:hypothetical protein
MADEQKKGEGKKLFPINPSRSKKILNLIIENE